MKSFFQLREKSELQEAEGGIKVPAGPDHDRKVKRIKSLVPQLGAKITKIGKSTDGKITTIHVKGNARVINDLMRLRTEEVDLEEAKMTDAKNKQMMRKALGVSKLGPKHANHTTAYANNGDFVVRDGAGRVVGRIAKESVNEQVDLYEASELEKRMAAAIQRAFNSLSAEEKAGFMRSYLKNPKAATDYMFQDLKKKYMVKTPGLAANPKKPAYIVKTK